jgi:hypothetical protein
MVDKKRRARTSKAAGEGTQPRGRAAARNMPAKFAERFVVLKKAAGVAGDRKTRRIGGRISPKLIALARRKTGIRSDTDLVEAGLLTLATEDEFGRWLIAQTGRLDKDLDLGI